MKRILAILMSIVMLTGMIAFAGCSKAEDNSSTSSDVIWSSLGGQVEP